MKITPHQEQFLEHLASKGIEFSSFHGSIGTFSIQANEIEPFLQDPDGFVGSKYYDAPKAQFSQWFEFQRHPNCHGTTKSGKPCRVIVHSGTQVKPHQYSLSNPELYCHNHTWQAQLYEEDSGK